MIPAAGMPSGGAVARGFALPMVLVILLALAVVSTTSAILTSSELRLTGIMRAGETAFLAAEAGLEHGTLRFGTEGPAAPDWPVGGLVDGYYYEVAARPDSFDFGGGWGEVSYDARAFGEPLNGDGLGDVVWVLEATASRESYVARQSLWLVPTAVPVVPGAVTATGSGQTTWEGGDVSGIDSTVDGWAKDSLDTTAPRTCGGNRPAFHSLSPAAPAPQLLADAVSGHAAYGGADPAFTAAGSGRWSGVEDVLGVEEGSLDGFQTTGLEHNLPLPDSLAGVTWITDQAGALGSCLSFQGCASVQGRGILIVHNPRYDPLEHDPAHPLYDPEKAADPANAPAQLHDLGGGTFRGLVVVDRLPEEPSGAIAIHGALVVLSAGESWSVKWPGGTLVEYSCDALVAAAEEAGLGPRRLAWRTE